MEEIQLQALDQTLLLIQAMAVMVVTKDKELEMEARV